MLATPYTTSSATGDSNCIAWGRSSQTWVYFSGIGTGEGITYVPALSGNSFVFEMSQNTGTGDSLLSVAIQGTGYTVASNHKYGEINAVGFCVGAPAWNTSYCFSGALAELVVFNRVLSTIEASSVRRYLSAISGNAVVG
jgi:hypothetical protein